MKKRHVSYWKSAPGTGLGATTGFGFVTRTTEETKESEDSAGNSMTDLVEEKRAR